MKFRVIANRPVRDDEPDDNVLDALRVLAAVVIALLLAVAAGMIYGRL